MLLMEVAIGYEGRLRGFAALSTDFVVTTLSLQCSYMSLWLLETFHALNFAAQYS